MFNGLTPHFSTSQSTVICFSNTYVTFIMCLELFCRIAFTGTLSKLAGPEN